MQRRPHYYKMLRDIDPALMQRIIKNPNFAVLQIEMDVYNLLVTWLFLRLNAAFEAPESSIAKIDEDSFHAEQMWVLGKKSGPIIVCVI